ncbi:hypothetical protein, partial [Thiolapillus sp.]|uniref:hypothetical protein n=1 Tax=Thiolapillus sp. TaxID=2017437 RepID=UPI003AF4CF22
MLIFPLAQGTPGKQCGLAATGDYTSLRFALHGWQRKNLIAIHTGSSLLIYRIHCHKFQGEFHSKRRGSLCNKHHSKPYA